MNILFQYSFTGVLIILVGGPEGSTCLCSQRALWRRQRVIFANISLSLLPHYGIFFFLILLHLSPSTVNMSPIDVPARSAPAPGDVAPTRPPPLVSCLTYLFLMLKAEPNWKLTYCLCQSVFLKCLTHTSLSLEILLKYADSWNPRTTESESLTAAFIIWKFNRTSIKKMFDEYFIHVSETIFHYQIFFGKNLLWSFSIFSKWENQYKVVIHYSIRPQWNRILLPSVTS